MKKYLDNTLSRNKKDLKKFHHKWYHLYFIISAIFSFIINKPSIHFIWFHPIKQKSLLFAVQCKNSSYKIWIIDWETSNITFIDEEKRISRTLQTQ